MSNLKANEMLDKLDQLAKRVKIICSELVAKNTKKETLNGRSVQKVGAIKKAG